MATLETTPRGRQGICGDGDGGGCDGLVVVTKLVADILVGTTLNAFPLSMLRYVLPSQQRYPPYRTSDRHYCQEAHALSKQASSR